MSNIPERELVPNYIRKYILENYAEVDELDANLIQAMVLEISDEFDIKCFVIDDVLNGFYDSYIDTYVDMEFKKIASKSYYKMRVKKYINEIIKKMLKSYDGYKDEEEYNNLLVYFAEKILKNELYNVKYEKILAGNYDNQIKQILYIQMREYTSNKSTIEVQKYVVSYIKNGITTKYKFLKNDDAVIKSLAAEITEYLLSVTSYQYILNRSSDPLIDQVLINKRRENMSFEKHDSEKIKPVKATFKIKDISQKIAALLLAATVIASVGVAIGGKVVDVSRETAVSRFDNFSYSPIFTGNSEMALDTIDNIIDFYYNISYMNNDNYNKLGFYRAYMEIAGNTRLAVMDTMFKNMVLMVKSDPEYSRLYSDISGYRCFLEFAYYQAIDMGCSELKGEKYRKAIDAYCSHLDDVIPYDELTIKEQGLVEKIIKLYKEYSEKEENKLGADLISRRKR